MEWLESLLPLVFLLIYYLAGAKRRREKRAAQAQPVAEGQPPKKQPTPFEQIIQQIQDAAEQAQNERQPAQPEPPTAFVDTAPAPLLPSATLETATSDFHAVGGFEHDQHGFGTANPFSEESFEQAPPSPAPPPHKPGHLDYDPHAGSGTRTLTQIKRRRGPHSAVRRLRQKGGLKEALIMKEIFDRPSRRK